jgi:hypothetical protein
LNATAELINTGSTADWVLAPDEVATTEIWIDPVGLLMVLGAVKVMLVDAVCIEVRHGVVVAPRQPTGGPEADCKLQVTDSFAVMLTDWPASMVGLVAGEVNWSPAFAGFVVVVAVVFPPPQLAISRQRTTQAPAR